MRFARPQITQNRKLMVSQQYNVGRVTISEVRSSRVINLVTWKMRSKKCRGNEEKKEGREKIINWSNMM